jgi:hypothetical protein
MKALFLFTLFISIVVFTPKVSEIRADYSRSNGNKELIVKLHSVLSSVEKKDNKVLVAYKGAVLTAMAKYAKGKKDKKDFFKEGAELLEYAVEAQPNDIEIRTIRLSIQENAPKFLRYNSDIDNDKAFILNNFKSTSSLEVREFVKSYVSQSEGFTTDEKKLLD